MISCIIFDLSEVIIAGLIGVERGLAKRLGVQESTVLPHLNDESFIRLLCGMCSEGEYLRAVRSASGWRVSDTELKKAIRDNFHQCIDGMPELVRHLSRAHELVLLSDHGREWITYIEGIHPCLGSFSRRIYSFETGMMKNSPAAFENVLRLLNKAGSECLFIDDNERNVACARAAGIAAIRFTGLAALKSDLFAMGLLDPVTDVRKCE